MVEDKVWNYSYVTIVLIFFFLGCGATKTVLHQPPKNKPIKFKIIEIPNFNKTDKKWVPYDSYSVIPDMVAEKLRNTNEFRLISRDESNNSSEERVLVVKGIVTGYDRGCKYCEWFFLGINDKGKSSVSVRVMLIDKTTGDIITDASIEGRAKEPGYGESRYIRIADEIVNLIQNVNNQ